ncbi:hypothetical protein [Mycobacterium sp.]|uniref:hypothetical protein n=1 Tax=Mycobacterium sp. TaxID=1785 RepID=UPI003F9DEC87
MTFAVSLGLGVGVGFLHAYFLPGISLAAGSYRLPPVSRILELGVLVPVVTFVAVLVAPLLVTARAAFRHPMDVVVTSALSGAALSLGLSLVVQHGAFTHLQATAGDPARVAFIALTLGFLQPIVFATAAAVAVLGLRSSGVNPAMGVVRGLVVLVLYGLAITLLAPYGARGIVLTAFAAFVLAGAGLLATHTALHTAVDAAPDVERVEHRLHGAVVAAMIAVVAIVAAGVTAAVVFSGPSTQPNPPEPGPGGIVPTTHAVASIHLASTVTPLAAGGASTVDFGDGVVLTVAPGWTIESQGRGYANLAIEHQSVGMDASAGTANRPDIAQEATMLIGQDIKARGLIDVRQQPQVQVHAVQGNNFQQALPINYTANLQNNLGTWPVYGTWIQLFNPAAHRGAFLDFYAISGDKYQASLPDVKSMLAAML